MSRSIDLFASHKPLQATQPHHAGKARLLDKRDLLHAFSGPETIIGRNESGVYTIISHETKSGDNIDLMLITGSDLQKVKTTMESIFLTDPELEPALDLAPGELDLRTFAKRNGAFRGRWRIFEKENFSFAIIANGGYEIRLSDEEAPKTFLRILESLGEAGKWQQMAQ